MSVGKRGLKWAAHNLHIVVVGADFRQDQSSTPDLIFVFPQGDMIFVRNNTALGWTVFSNSFGTQYGLTVKLVIDRAHAIATELDIEKLPIEYITIYDIETHVITILRVNGALPSPGIHIRFESINNERKLVWSVSKEVLELLNRKPENGWIAFHDCRIG